MGTIFGGDPLFVDRSSNLRVRSGSPAIDAAAAAYSQPADHEGTARPQGSGPDIGAFER